MDGDDDDSSSSSNGENDHRHDSELEEGEISDRSDGEDDARSPGDLAPVHKTALPVAEFTEAFTEHSIPTTGPEYLAIVRLQSSRLPDIVSCENSPRAATRPARSLGDRREPIRVSKEQASEILDHFDKAHCRQDGMNERECLEAFVKAVDEKDFQAAHRWLTQLDTRLTANQSSLLRTAAMHSGDAQLLVIVAYRFGQTDLVELSPSPQ